jgi:hypothetical protein
MAIIGTTTVRPLVQGLAIPQMIITHEGQGEVDAVFHCSIAAIDEWGCPGAESEIQEAFLLTDGETPYPAIGAWEAVPGAAGYRVYFYEKTGEEYSFLGSGDTTELTEELLIA